MRRPSLFFSSLVVVFLVLFLVPTSNAQCLYCVGDPGTTTVSCALGICGNSSCTVTDAGACKLSGQCTAPSCDGGGGGGPCAAWTQPVRQPGQSVATIAFLFESDAASNAHLFGGRGHGLRVVSGVAFGTLTPDVVVQQIRSLSGGKVGVLALVTSFANFNSGGVAVSLGHGTDGGIEFAPVASGVGSSFEVHWKGASQLENAIESADLQPQDLLLLDVSIQGKAYVLALSAKSLDLRTPEGQKLGSETIREFTRAIRSYPIRVSNPPIHIC